MFAELGFDSRHFEDVKILSVLKSLVDFLELERGLADVESAQEAKSSLGKVSK